MYFCTLVGCGPPGLMAHPPLEASASISTGSPARYNFKTCLSSGFPDSASNVSEEERLCREAGKVRMRLLSSKSFCRE
eukprot:scaffold3418_cov124-Isochrysis_galbana.AAC.2